MSAAPAIDSWQAAFDAEHASAEQREAFAAFLAQGLPSAKNDAWKYTDLRRLTLKRFAPARAAANAAVDAPLLFERGLIFVDGALRSSIGLEQQLSIETAAPLPSASIREPGAQAFALLNTALATQALRIHVANDASLHEPIYIAHVWTKNANGVMRHPRVALTLGKHGKATLIEHFVGANEEANFTNAVFDIEVEAGASLDHIRIQDDASVNFNVASLRARVAQDASYRQYQYVFGGGLARANVAVALSGEHSQTELHGLIFVEGAQHLDVHTCIDHAVPNTTSREDYRGIADHRGRVVFNGKVIVAKDAQRTDAAQSSRNLLLSPHAEIDTRPELQIDANDVKCAHGATVGQLDASALFYLQSRGIARHEARALLTQAFAAELIERAPVQAVREYVTGKLMSRLRAHGDLA